MRPIPRGIGPTDPTPSRFDVMRQALARLRDRVGDYFAPQHEYAPEDIDTLAKFKSMTPAEKEAERKKMQQSLEIM